MAGDDVPAQFVAQLQRLFQIERRALGPAVLHGAGDGFGGDVDREPCVACYATLVHYGQAHARAGDRGAHGDPCGVEGASDDRAQVAGLAGFADLADGGYNSGEHGYLSSDCSDDWAVS